MLNCEHEHCTALAAPPTHEVLRQRIQTSNCMRTNMTLNVEFSQKILANMYNGFGRAVSFLKNIFEFNLYIGFGNLGFFSILQDTKKTFELHQFVATNFQQ